MKIKLLLIAMLVSSISFAQQTTFTEVEVIEEIPTRKPLGKNAFGINEGYTHHKTGFNFNYQRIFEDKKWGYRVDLAYLDKRTNYTHITNSGIDKKRVGDKVFFVGAAYNYWFKKLVDEPFYFYGYLGVHYSNEQLKVKDHCQCYEKPEENLYGFYTGVEFQYRFSNQVSLVAMYQLQQNFNSDIEKWNFLAGLGFKFNFN